MKATSETTESPRFATPLGRPGFSAAAFFAQKDRLVRWCVLTSFASIACVVLSLCVALGASTMKVWFVALDPAGNVWVEPGEKFEKAQHLHLEQALLATTALLLRNPNGFDLPEVLQVFATPSALEQALTLKSAENTEFQEKQIHQKPLVSRVEAIEVRPDSVLILTAGQLVRNGQFQQQKFTEVVPFVLKLALKKNPDLLRQRRQPTIVTDFQLSYETNR